MVTSKTDPSNSVIRARAAFPVDCFFFGVCALASDNGAGAAVGDFASAGIFTTLICHTFQLIFSFVGFFSLYLLFVNPNSKFYGKKREKMKLVQQQQNR